MTKRGAYVPHSRPTLVRMAIVWLVTALFVYAAWTWEGGMDTGLFMLSPATASVVLWALVAIMLPGALLFLHMLLKGDLTPRSEPGDPSVMVDQEAVDVAVPFKRSRTSG